MAARGGRGCGSTFLGCFTAGILVLVVAGVALYFVVPRFLKDVDKKVVPWLESKGRVFAGRMALLPLSMTINQSDLTSEEKKEWNDFLDAKWALASASNDESLSREVLINASRETVGTYSGLYYALLAIGDRDFKKTSLTSRQIELGQKLISTVTAHMLDGAYSQDELITLRTGLYSVLTGWRVGTENEQGQRVDDINLRKFLRALQLLTQQEKHYGDNQPRDMNAEFQNELLAFKQRIEREEEQMRQESGPTLKKSTSKTASGGDL